MKKVHIFLCNLVFLRLAQLMNHGVLRNEALFGKSGINTSIFITSMSLSKGTVLSKDNTFNTVLYLKPLNKRQNDLQFIKNISVVI